jgi:co-chaperonin GroES (HSP10)
MEELLPDSPEEDSDDDGVVIVGEQEEDTSEEQRTVGVLNGETVDEPTTYAGRKEATNRRIAELLGNKVTINRGRNKTLEWVVVN